MAFSPSSVETLPCYLSDIFLEKLSSTQLDILLILYRRLIHLSAFLRLAYTVRFISLFFNIHRYQNLDDTIRKVHGVSLQLYSRQ